MPGSRISRSAGPSRRARPRGAHSRLLLLAASALAAILPSGGFAANPLRPEEASLLAGVDAARGCVVTVIGIPVADARPEGRLRKRLIATGVVFADHRVVTTASVAVHGGLLRILLAEGDERTARLRGIDRQSNLSLLEVGGPPLRPLRQAPPQSVAVGSWVAVVANSGAVRPQVMLGQVVGRGERVDFPYAGEVVEIDAQVAPGSGGGAILNEDGEWVAIVVGRAGEASPGPSGVGEGAADPLSPGADGVLVALPVDQVDRIVEDLEEFGSVRRGFLGIRLRFEPPSDSLGIAIQEVVPRSPAAQAGLQPGDRILAFEGDVARSADALTASVRAMRPGEEVGLTVARGSEIFPVRIVLGSAVRDELPGGRVDRTDELLRLKKELRRLNLERAKVEEQIRTIQGGASGR